MALLPVSPPCNNGVMQSVCEETFLSPTETLTMALANRMTDAEAQAEAAGIIS